MKNKIKMGVVEMNGICIGDVIDGLDGVVIGFKEVDKVWFVECGYDGEVECSALLEGVVN